MAESMILKPILDFETLLAPLAGPRPTGVFLRGEDDSDATLYYDLRSAYNQAKNDEAKKEQARYLAKDDPAAEFKPPDWDDVQTKAVSILAKSSKDLWVVARLIEALFRTHGFTGLCEGLRLARRLCEEYWDDLYPLRQETTRYQDRVHDFGPLLSNDKLLRLPILQAALSDTRELTVFDYQNAVELEALKSKNPEAFEKRRSEDAVTLADFESDVRESGPAFYRELAQAIGECLEEFDALTSALDERLEADERLANEERAAAWERLAADEGLTAQERSEAEERLAEAARHVVALPSAAQVRDALHTCEQAVRNIAPAAFAEADSAASAGAAGAPSSSGAAGPAMAVASGGIASRQQAFQALEQIARFFEKTEPQSFIPFSLRQIVRRGELSLPELLAELIADDGARSDLSRLTGVPQVERRDN
jgi:type VI secretion system protein ImpA